MSNPGNANQEVTMPVLTTAPARSLAWEDQVHAAEIAAERETDDFGPDPERFLSEWDFVGPQTADLEEIGALEEIASWQQDMARAHFDNA